MNKKVALVLLLVVALGLGAGMGTMALYKAQFEVEQNTVTSAKFDPSVGYGMHTSFEVNKMYPGYTNIHDFGDVKRVWLGTVRLDMTNTQVPTAFEVTLTPNGGVFEGINDLEERVYYYIYSQSGSLIASNDPERSVNSQLLKDNSIVLEPEKSSLFFVDIKWSNEDDNDILWQGMTGQIDLDITAIQDVPEETVLKAAALSIEQDPETSYQNRLLNLEE